MIQQQFNKLYIQLISESKILVNILINVYSIQISYKIKLLAFLLVHAYEEHC